MACAYPRASATPLGVFKWRKMTSTEFPGPGLSTEHWGQIRNLATSLSPSQLMWVSGYFAGLDDAHRESTTAPQSHGPGAAVTAPSPAGARALTILHGTETGNSADLAQATAAAAATLGLRATVVDMAEYKVRKLKEEHDLLIITSTHGEGDPPPAAADFFEYLEGRKAPRLEQLRFSVLALGDSTYEKFCEAGRRLDRRLEELGGVRLHARVDCDVDFEAASGRWIEAVLSGLAASKSRETSEARVVAHAGVASPVAAPPPPRFDKTRPFMAPVIDNIVLTGRGSTKETRHIEISLAGSGLTYTPGDALGVAPRNDPDLVGKLLVDLGLSGETRIQAKDGVTSLARVLEQDVEITATTPRFLEQWFHLSGASALGAMLRTDNFEARNAFMRSHQICDVVRLYPVRGVDPEAVVSGLRPLQPRLYSIASSLAAAEDEAHLTVSTVRYQLHGESRCGVASGQLADRTPIESTLPVYIHPNPRFRLPEPERPVIMIGAGTGVAPFRAFMQEREAQEARGKSWLFFGERNFRTDFLYQTEWQRFLKDGVLTRLDVAFSRDDEEKVYVQHRLLEQAASVYAWLQEGAHIYVCGDASKLAPDVHGTLATILMEQGGLSHDAARDRLRTLAREHRYQRDIY